MGPRACRCELTSAGNEHCDRGTARGQLDICERDRGARLAWGGGGQAGPQRGAPARAAQKRRAPTGHIGPQGHLVVVDNPSRSGAPEVGPKVVVVHLGVAESALEARTQV